MVEVGSAFALLALAHFVVDWVFQGNKTAATKHSNWKVRARHCTVYAGGMTLAVWLLLSPTTIPLLVSAGIFWVSHFILDTYIGVFRIWMWQQYGFGVFKRPYRGSHDLALFTERFASPIGKRVGICIDQQLHLIFLLVVILICI